VATDTGTRRPQVPETGRDKDGRIAADLMRYREEAGVNALEINFHGNHDLGQLLDSLDHLMHEAEPPVA